MEIAVSKICQAFDPVAVGTRVIYEEDFMDCLEKKLPGVEFKDGVAEVSMDEALHTVTSGIAKRAFLTTSDYVVREWRGEIHCFAKRVHSAVAEHLKVIVYTKEQYTFDRQVDPTEAARVKFVDYIIVAVLASVIEEAQISSHRFVRNLAGGNSQFSPEKGYTLQEAIRHAKKIVEYEREWVTVSD